MKTMMKGEAERIAIDALLYIGQDTERLGRFLDLTGYTADRIRAAAEDPTFLEGVMRHMIGSEPLLIEFSIWRDMQPEAVVAAAEALGAVEQA